MRTEFNLFLIGAPKAGTTSVWKVLNDVPEIAMCPIKEPCLFSFKAYKSRVEDVFESGWAEKEDFSYIGEASPIYSEVLLGPEIPSRIFEQNPRAKIIFIVRNPVDRMLSNWRQTKSTGHEHIEAYVDKTDVSVGLMPSNFNEAIRTYPTFLNGSKYWSIYKAYAAVFPESQIKVLLYEDLKENPRIFYSSLFKFLDLSTPDDLCVNIKVNVGAGKRSTSGLYLKLKNSILGSFARNVLPGMGKKLKPIFSKKIKITNAMRAETQELVREQLLEESEMILKHCGRTKAYWKL